ILKLTNKRVGERKNVKAETLEWMGRAYIDQGRHAKAITVLLECLEVREKILAKIESTEAAKDEHIELLDTISWLVKAYQASGKLDEAEELAKRMVREKTELLGASDPLTLDSLAWIVLLLGDRQRYEEMEVKAKELLEGRLNAGGPDDPATWTANYWVGRAYCHLGKFEESEVLLRDVWEKRKVKLGENHLDTLTVLSWLGRLCTDAKKYEEANKLRVEELERRIQVQGETNINNAVVLEALVAIRCKMGDLDAAESYCNEAIEIRKLKGGEKSLGYANARAWLGEVCFLKQKYEESVAIRRGALATRMELLEPRHRLIGFSKCKLALVLHTMGGHDAEAEELIKEGVEIMKDTVRADDPSLEEALDILKKIIGEDTQEATKATGPQTEPHVPQTS
ncbi:16553_t:CDS:1, partial [Acaulospora colombiana]